ncbi:MAG: stage III sporulation protein AB [Lachnospiraceae bacterium]|nr:stage III sporulation protein AB [Lachnospiraceae bacterium]
MLKGIGICCTLLGAIGCCFSMIHELDIKKKCLQQLLWILEMLEVEIHYSRSTLAEACIQIGQKAGTGKRDPILKLPEQIGLYCQEQDRAVFATEWKAVWKPFLKQCYFSENESEILATFPVHTGFLNGEMQENAIQGYRKSVTGMFVEAENSFNMKKKLILSFGLCGSLLLVILLL